MLSGSGEEVLRAGVEHSLGVLMYSNAVWLAERLVELSPSEESVVLLGTVLLRAGKKHRAVAVLEQWIAQRVSMAKLSSQFRYLLAVAYVDTDRSGDAESALRGGYFPLTATVDASTAHAIAGGAAGMCLLASICKATKRTSEALTWYRLAVKLCPTLWTAYEALAAMGEVDATSTDLFPEHDDEILSALRAQPHGPFSCSWTESKENRVIDSNSKNIPERETAEVVTGCNGGQLTPRKRTVSVSPITTLSPVFVPAIDVLDGAPRESAQLTPSGLMTPSPPRGNELSSPPPLMRPTNQGRQIARTLSGQRDSGLPATGSHRTPEYMTSTRRASKMSTMITAGNLDENRQSHSAETTTMRMKIAGASTVAPEADHSNPLWSGADMIRCFGLSIGSLHRYDCTEALKLLNSFPDDVARTGYVLSLMARCYLELGDYKVSQRFFDRAIATDQSKLDGLVEYYSTVLWHGKDQKALADLAHQCMRIDKTSAATWCVVGNCFSLQRDPDSALRFFRRALSVDPSSAYAHTLCGHEFAMKEDFASAMEAYRQALRVDDRHYNAWYGIGSVYYRQEHYEWAESHFRNAIRVHSRSSTLHYHLGLALHAAGRPFDALQALDTAIRLDPGNPVAKFERSKVLAHLNEHESALRQLLELHDTFPREAAVQFEIGRSYKKMGQKDQALKHFSIALDLDPKERMYKKAIDSLEESGEE
uniref:UDP-N-acetylglucosamine--peptide N-acetylglucosaminyltransferase SPINDLY n=1 Tax=Compsopogon caeruleus TaxID=31354 RepID=A0A7S1TAI0_9RHOD